MCLQGIKDPGLLLKIQIVFRNPSKYLYANNCNTLLRLVPLLAL